MILLLTLIRGSEEAKIKRLTKKEHAVIAEERIVVEGIHTMAPPSVSIQTTLYELVNCLLMILCF